MIKIWLASLFQWTVTHLILMRLELYGELEDNQVDIWEGDVNSIPFEHTNEALAIEQLEEYIGSQIPLK